MLKRDCVILVNEILFRFLNASAYHIDTEVGRVGDRAHWRLTRFYGFAATSERYKSWELLRSLSDLVGLPWLVFGDFSKVMLAFEKNWW